MLLHQSSVRNRYEGILLFDDDGAYNIIYMYIYVYTSRA